MNSHTIPVDCSVSVLLCVPFHTNKIVLRPLFVTLNLFLHWGAVVFATNDAHVDTDQILGTARFAQNRAVLLQVVSFTGNESHALFSV